MKKLILLLTITAFAFGGSLKWEMLTDEQREVAKRIYDVAILHDLAETMIAIAWQESRLGKIAINLADNASCGVHHIHIKTYLWLNGIKSTITNKNYWCAALIKSPELSTISAITLFERARTHFRGDYNAAIKSHNAGYNIHSKAANNYLKSVKGYLQDAKKIVEVIETLNAYDKGTICETGGTKW